MARQGESSRVESSRVEPIRVRVESSQQADGGCGSQVRAQVQLLHGSQLLVARCQVPDGGRR